MTDIGWAVGEGDDSSHLQATAQWNAIDTALYRPVKLHLFDDTDYLDEPLQTTRRIALALCQGCPDRLATVATSLSITDIRLILGMKYKYTVSQLTTLLHTSTSEVLRRAHDLATVLSPLVLVELYES